MVGNYKKYHFGKKCMHLILNKIKCFHRKQKGLVIFGQNLGFPTKMGRAKRVDTKQRSPWLDQAHWRSNLPREKLAR